MQERAIEAVIGFVRRLADPIAIAISAVDRFGIAGNRFAWGDFESTGADPVAAVDDAIMRTATPQLVKFAIEVKIAGKGDTLTSQGIADLGGKITVTYWGSALGPRDKIAFLGRSIPGEVPTVGRLASGIGPAVGIVAI